MTSTKKDPVIVVLQLTGGNDFFNTVIPYTDPLYYDNRPVVKYEQEDIIKINDEIGLMPTMGPIKEMYDQGKVAIVPGVGYANSPRSHFRSMDIWHTCEPDKVGTEGWAGRLSRELDPNKENVLTAINFGHGLPRALAVPGVPVSGHRRSGHLRAADGHQRPGPAGQGSGPGSRGCTRRRWAGASSTTTCVPPAPDAMVGADIVKVAPERYSSNVEYPNSPIAMHLRDIAQVYLADLGTRVFYTQHGEPLTPTRERWRGTRCCGRKSPRVSRPSSRT